MNNNKALTLTVKDFEALDIIASRAYTDLAEAKGAFIKANILASGIQELQLHLGPMMDAFMPLQNSSLGFKTDQAAGYSKDVVRDAVIEATLRGVQVVGNQFNIISGRCYITKEGYEHKLRNHKGFTDFKANYGVPKMHPNGEGAIVECNASWTFNGKADEMKAEIPVRVNKGMGTDAILGKATRKFLKRVFERITGCSEVENVPDEDAAIDRAKPANVATVETAKPNFGGAEGVLNV